MSIFPSRELLDYGSWVASAQWDRFCSSSGIDSTAVTGLGDLDADAVGALERMFTTAKETRSRELSAAVDSGIGFLPRLMRIPVRKIIFG